MLVFLNDFMKKKCFFCCRLITHLVIKKITIETIGLKYGSNKTLIEEKVNFICPRCQNVIYTKKDDDEGRLTEIAKKIYQSL